MKAKIVRGRGFRGALDYALDEGPRATGEKGGEIVGGNLAGRNAAELAAEFGAVRRLRPDIERPVWHASLSLPRGENLSAEQWEAVAARYMAKMGFDLATTPWVVARHSDTAHEHVHIIASRVGIDGKVWLGQWEARHAIEATQELEREFGLTATPGLDARAERKRPRDGERRRAERTGEVPVRVRLQQRIDEAIEAGARDVPALVEALAARGVEARPNIASTGRVSGFSFALDGVAFRGSDLGKRYSWGGLQRAGISEQAAAAPKPAPDPLDRYRDWVREAERGGDAVELVQRRAELAAAAALVAQGEPPAHHSGAIRGAGTAAALAYLRGEAPHAEPRRAAESGDPQAGGATGRATPERPAVGAAAAFRAELEREQQRRDAERQAKRRQLTAEIVAAQVERAKLVAERAEKRRFADSPPEIARLDISAEQEADKAARRRLADEQARGWLARLFRGSARRDAEREAEQARAALDAATERQRQAAERDRETAMLERRLTRIEVDSLAGHIAAIDRQLPDLRAALAALDADPKPAAPEAVAPVQVQERTPEPRRPAAAPEAPKPTPGPLERFERQLRLAKRDGDPGEIGSALDELIAARRLIERGGDPENDDKLWAELQDVWRERAAGALPSREEALAELERPPETPTERHRAPKQRSRGPRGPRGAEYD
jgi:hypothetical protein